MRNKRRLINLLGATSLTVLVLTIFFTFDGPVIMAGLNTVENTSTVTTMEDLQSQNSELAAALETFQEREAQYREQIQAANNAVTQLEEEMGSNATTSKEGFASYEKAIGELQTQNTELLQTLQTMQEREAEYLAQIESANLTIQEVEQGTWNNSNTYENAVAQLQQENANLVETLQAMQGQEAQFQAQIYNANQVITQLQQDAANNSGTYEQAIATLQAENAQARAALEGLQAQNAEAMAALEGLQAQNAEAMATLEAFQAQNSELTQTVATLQGRESEHQVLTTSYQELESTYQGREATYQANIAGANQTIVDLESRLGTSNEQLAALESQNNELVTLLETMRAREAEYQAQIEKANQTIQELQANAANTNSGSQGYHDDDDDEGDDDDDD